MKVIRGRGIREHLGKEVAIYIGYTCALTGKGGGEGGAHCFTAKGKKLNVSVCPEVNIILWN